MMRVVEPELMGDMDQADSYHTADRSESRKAFVRLYKSAMNSLEGGFIIDLGCGAGDYDIELSKIHPHAHIDAYDGSLAMIDIAYKATQSYKNIDVHCENFLTANMPVGKYDRVVSCYTLHHIHQPTKFWEVVAQVAKPDGDVFIFDMVRPSSEQQLEEIINKCAIGDKMFEIDFKNSLRAAFTKEEIEQQLKDVDLNLEVLEFADPKSPYKIVVITGML